MRENNWRRIGALFVSKMAATVGVRQFTPPAKPEGVDELAQRSPNHSRIGALIGAELAQAGAEFVAHSLAPHAGVAA